MYVNCTSTNDVLEFTAYFSGAYLAPKNKPFCWFQQVPEVVFSSIDQGEQRIKNCQYFVGKYVTPAGERVKTRLGLVTELVLIGERPSEIETDSKKFVLVTVIFPTNDTRAPLQRAQILIPGPAFDHARRESKEPELAAIASVFQAIAQSSWTVRNSADDQAARDWWDFCDDAQPHLQARSLVLPIVPSELAQLKPATTKSRTLRIVPLTERSTAPPPANAGKTINVKVIFENYVLAMCLVYVRDVVCAGVD